MCDAGGISPKKPLRDFRKKNTRAKVKYLSKFIKSPASGSSDLIYNN